MSPKPEDNTNNDYAKDINLLSEDLQREVQPSVEVEHSKAPRTKDRQYAQTQRQEPQKAQSKTLSQPKGVSLSSFFKKLFSKRSPKPNPPEEPKESKHELEFKPSAQPRLHVSVQDVASPQSSRPTLPEKETVNLEPQPTPPKSPTPGFGQMPKPPSPQSASSKADTTSEDMSAIDLLADMDTYSDATSQKSSTLSVDDKKNTKQQPEKEADSSSFRAPFASIKELIGNDEDADEVVDADQAFDVNLIPSEIISAEAKHQALRQVIIVGVASVLFVGVVYVLVGFADFSGQGRIEEIRTKVAAIKEEIAKSQETINQLSGFTKQTQLVSTLLEGQKRWTKLFDMIERETIPEVYYTSVTVAENEKVTIQVVARTYNDLARQYLIFESVPGITDLEMSASNLDSSTWEKYLADLETEYSQQLLLYEEGEIDELPVFSTPSYNEIQSYLVVNSSFSFTFDTSK